MGTFKINGELELNSYLTAATTLYVSSADNKSIIFKHGSTEYVRINPSGCLNIGSTQAASTYKLYVAGKSWLSDTLYFNSTASYINASDYTGNAATATKLTTATAGDSDTPVYFTGGQPTACTSLDLDTTGNAATATKLANSRTIRTNLGSTSTASFNGTKNITPGVTGTLAIGNGGTGATTAENAFWNLYARGMSDNLNDSLTVGGYAWQSTTTNTPVSGTWGSIFNFISMDGPSHNNTNNWIWQLGFQTESNNVYLRSKTNNGGWRNWASILTSDNYSSWAAPASHSHSYLPLSGGTMTGSPAIKFPASAGSISTSDPMAITYGRISAYGTLCINANSDNSGTEYVILTAGKGHSSSTNDGLAVGTSTLTWQGNNIIHAGNIGSQSVNYASSAGSATKATQDQHGYNLYDHYNKRHIQTVNLTGYNANTWYPVLSNIPTGGLRRVACVCQLNTGSVPSWSNHSAGFTAVVEMLVTASGWGTTGAYSICLANDQRFIYDGNNPPIGYRQWTNSSNACFWCRGGGIYILETDYMTTWTVYGSSTSINSETVAPTTSYPGMNYAKSRIYANLSGDSIYGAVWNDYAEFRTCNTEFKPGQVVYENGDDTMDISYARLQKGCSLTSDTFGFAIGETDDAKCPIAVSGRVLAYPYESREEFRNHIGDPVCSGPDGTVSIMTEQEEIQYPSRIIGTISAVPDYETWGTGNVTVDNRVWIKVK